MSSHADTKIDCTHSQLSCIVGTKDFVQALQAETGARMSYLGLVMLPAYQHFQHVSHACTAGNRLRSLGDFILSRRNLCRTSGKLMCKAQTCKIIKYMYLARAI